mmetsp:Transcript_87442/g.155083  ORF Transcript_87442/g.155083 Transcript_87442/m.155083 type:complete len:308 (+) Transcript_87442:72-995(+)|eukprot:CAMPEP_0197652980 /NCGR_PEP_ID=MMETSP1338-20131121/34776_1 /TAXON_ID=43686 ORGANISM="Pelagodinium beii, Strain RCC1491" /NCGR_SAMPLE_ID=MMETSP1338 /ASSEMBLY_ACC=CAM_ASM_000754 /LENGTH=307 /DNA_ID=CAMNT_0043227961 /DNA_START=50 /DNA_END=973 /DNA_ORIENTATION=+
MASKRKRAGAETASAEATLAALQESAQESTKIHAELTVQRISNFLKDKPALAEHVWSQLQDGLIVDPSVAPSLPKDDKFGPSVNKVHLLPEAFIRKQMNKFYPDDVAKWTQWKRIPLARVLSNRIWVDFGSAIQSKKAGECDTWITERGSNPMGVKFGEMGLHATADGKPDWAKMSLFNLVVSAEQGGGAKLIFKLTGAEVEVTGTGKLVADAGKLTLKDGEKYKDAFLTDNEEYKPTCISLFKKGAVNLDPPLHMQHVPGGGGAAPDASPDSSASSDAQTPPRLAAIPKGNVHVPPPPGGWGAEAK